MVQTWRDRIRNPRHSKTMSLTKNSKKLSDKTKSSWRD